MPQIKLVIWGLDNTLWEGEISNGEVRPYLKTIQSIKFLSKKGIINSIISINDFNQAKAKIEELNLWSHFTFPKILFEFKGSLINDIISHCELKAQNVLVVNDEIGNLEEIKCRNPDINVGYRKEISNLMQKHEFAEVNEVIIKKHKTLESQ